MNGGHILEISEQKLEIPIIIGLTTIVESDKIGNRLDDNDLIKLNTVLKITELAKNTEIFEKITSIDVNDDKDFILNLEKEQKVVHLVDTTNLSDKIPVLKKILEQESGKSGKIFFNDSKKCIFREE